MNIDKNALGTALLASLAAVALTQATYERLPSTPHHVTVKLNNVVLQDYWTNNPVKVTREMEFGISTNAFAGMVWVNKTNKLW